MKILTGPVTNSSSTGYIVHVKSKELRAEDMVITLFKDPNFVDEFNSYSFAEEMRVTQIIDALNEHYDFPLKEGSHDISFGDEQDNAAGLAFDYCLRDGFTFPDFEVSFLEHRR